MRPRPEGRGEPQSQPLQRWANAVLQCGHGPKTVENARPLVGIVARGLQCGHGPKAVENSESLQIFRRLSWICFNAATARRPWRTSTYGSCDRVHRLQCGHGPKTVENPASAHVAPPVSFNAATARRPWRTPSDVGFRRPLMGFNAATARRPWRTASVVPTEDHSWLQCGHGPKTVENSEWYVMA